LSCDKGVTGRKEVELTSLCRRITEQNLVQN